MYINTKQGWPYKGAQPSWNPLKTTTHGVGQVNGRKTHTCTKKLQHGSWYIFWLRHCGYDTGSVKITFVPTGWNPCKKWGTKKATRSMTLGVEWTAPTRGEIPMTTGGRYNDQCVQLWTVNYDSSEGPTLLKPYMPTVRQGKWEGTL